MSHVLSQLDGFQRHFDSQIITYGKQVILNLVCCVCVYCGHMKLRLLCEDV